MGKMITIGYLMKMTVGEYVKKTIFSFLRDDYCQIGPQDLHIDGDNNTIRSCDKNYHSWLIVIA